MSETLPQLPDTPYWHAYQSRFAGFPTWAMHDRFWPLLRQSGDAWFLFEPESGGLPEAPMTGEEFQAVLDQAEALFEPARARSFAGIVFADDTETPGFVKLFDPWKMGASCGSSGERILPRWALSRIRPDAIVPPAPVAKRGSVFSRFAARP